MVYGSGLENQRGESLREFKSHPLRFAFVAQLVERGFCKADVASSNLVEGFYVYHIHSFEWGISSVAKHPPPTRESSVRVRYSPPTIAL